MHRQSYIHIRACTLFTLFTCFQRRIQGGFADIYGSFANTYGSFLDVYFSLMHVCKKRLSLMNLQSETKSQRRSFMGTHDSFAKTYGSLVDVHCNLTKLCKSIRLFCPSQAIAAEWLAHTWQTGELLNKDKHNGMMTNLRKRLVCFAEIHGNLTYICKKLRAL